MKKFMWILSIAILLLGLSACKSPEVIEEEDPIVCDSGFHLDDGECVEDEIIPVECLDGYVIVDNQCVLDDTFEVTSGINQVGDGSFYSGRLPDFAHPALPTFLDSSLSDSAVPSNGWWTSLLVANHGGSNGIYTNPLRLSYTNEGMEITNPEDGFVQYWNVDGLQTIAQFPIALKDSFLKPTSLSSSYQTKVIGYGDAHVQVAMRNVGSTTNQMVTTLVQGSPYVFVEVNDGDTLTYTLDVNAVNGYEYYDVSGTPITSPYTGNAIVVKMVQRHSGYDTSPPANVMGAQYSDKYYLINAPDNTVFTMSSHNHPSSQNNRVQIELGDGDYLSIAAINTLSEAPFYHQHGYAFITDTSITYDVDYDDSIVTTSFDYTVEQKHTSNQADALIALMPHHYKNSDVTLSNYSYRTVRGTLKLFEGSSFTTSLSFHGLLPGFTVPTNDAFQSSDTITYLNDLNDRIDITDSEDFINFEGPYWNGKAMYPLAQGIIIADQLGEDSLRDSFIEKLRYVLEDWYTYTDATDEKFLFYDDTWGSVYYSNDDFGTASALSDHSFTHGYLIYASSVLAMYDPTFVSEYGQMVDVLLNDYMYPRKDQSSFEYLRSFDPFAGHSWAHGFGTFAEGNNLESTSEALNSWNGGYLWSLATNNQERRDAAIYGFVTELSAIKEYWFDYDDTNWDPAFGDYVDVAGMIWGGKHDYATWFGANPTFIYGIHWLPTGEFLTNYAMNDEEHAKLTSIYQTYLNAKGGSVDTWFSNMWAIQAITDSDTALSLFDSNLILTDDYPNELVGSYWMIHAMDSLQRRTSEVWMEIHPHVASSIYEPSDGVYEAMVWNPTDTAQTISFYDASGLLLTYTVDAYTFEQISLN